MATKEEIKLQLDELGVKYSPSDKKETLERKLGRALKKAEVKDEEPATISETGVDVKEVERIIDEVSTPEPEIHTNTIVKEVVINGRKYKQTYYINSGTTEVNPL